MQSKETPNLSIDPLPGIHQITDPRDSYLVHYSLPEVLFLVVAASVSYCDKLTEMAVFGEEKLEWLAFFQILVAVYPKADGRRTTNCSHGGGFIGRSPISGRRW